MDGGLLYVPATTVSSVQWVRPSECVWASPLKSLETSIVLKTVYLEAFQEAIDDLPQLESFFKKTLGVKDCDWANVVEELENIQSLGAPDIDQVIELYRCLENMQPNASEEESLK